LASLLAQAGRLSRSLRAAPAAATPAGPSTSSGQASYARALGAWDKSRTKSFPTAPLMSHTCPIGLAPIFDSGSGQETDSCRRRARRCGRRWGRERRWAVDRVGGFGGPARPRPSRSISRPSPAATAMTGGRRRGSGRLSRRWRIRGASLGRRRWSIWRRTIATLCSALPVRRDSGGVGRITGGGANGGAAEGPCHPSRA
jgi:hypothetical protein